MRLTKDKLRVRGRRHRHGALVFRFCIAIHGHCGSDGGGEGESGRMDAKEKRPRRADLSAVMDPREYIGFGLSITKVTIKLQQAGVTE